MDLFAKAVKKGVAKGYAIGQQQLQQHLAKQREPGAEPSHGNANGYSAQHGVGGDAFYSSYPQQQQQPQQYPTYNGPPPLPPRQYQPPQPQSNYTTHPASQNSPVSYGIPAPVSYDPASSQIESSYGSIMPPAPPSYVPPPASTQPIQPQATLNPPPVDSQRQDVTTSNEYDWRQDERLKPFLQPLRDITAGFRDVTAPPTTDVTHVQPQPQPQQTEARQDTQGYLVRTSDGGFQLVQPDQQPAESLSYTAPLTTTNPEAQTQQPTSTRPDYTATIEPRVIESRQTQETRTESTEQRNPDVSTSVEQQLSNLSLGGASMSETAPKSHQKAKKAISLPPIVADGPGQEVVRFCPKDRLVDYPLYWYFLPDLPDAPICTRCHADYIQSSPLADSFTRKLAEADTVSSCHFRYPRVQNVLWPAALRSRSLDDLAAFLSARLLIPNCKGRTATAAADGVKYFGMRDNDIDGFIACEACVQDHVAGTAFAARLVPYPRAQGPDDRWMCDASVRYVARALAHYAPRGDWRGFVDGAARRFKLAACDGQEKARGDSGNWFATRPGPGGAVIDNVQVCEPCFMDRLALGPFADEFAQMPGPVDFDEYIVFLRQRWTCSLADGAALPMACALAAAEETGDFAGFARAAAAIAQLVPCTQHGIIRGNWWTVAGGDDDDGDPGSEAFNLCEACLEGIMKPRGLDTFLRKKTAPGPEDTVVCNLCPSTARHDEYARKLTEVLDRGVFGGFAEHVRTFAAVRHCPRRDSLAGARWWGYGGEALACEECWLLFARHTAVAERLPLRGVRDERAQICSLYSPRMRGRWQALCEAAGAGEAEAEEEAAVVEFREFATRRLQVWLATVPKMQFMREMKQLKMIQAMHQGQLSLMYQGMNSMAVLSGTDDGHWHGNSSIGWYETENGATGAKMFNNMQAGMADASRGDEWMQIFQMELQWQEVE